MSTRSHLDFIGKIESRLIAKYLLQRTSEKPVTQFVINLKKHIVMDLLVLTKMNILVIIHRPITFYGIKVLN